MSRFRFIVSGRVQGVAFRFTLKKFILNNYPHIHGFIRNLSTGEVELVVDVTADECHLIEEACRKVVLMARVDSISTFEIEDSSEDLPYPFCVYPNK